MAETVYASFADTKMAERAVGALLDHGMQKEDLTLVSHAGTGDDDGAEATAKAASLRRRVRTPAPVPRRVG